MAKIVLDDFYDFDFTLIGIACHSKDYRLAWEINQTLLWDLVREADLTVKTKKDEARHSFFSFEEEENFKSYFLMGNRSENGYLIPERKEIDFFLQLKGDFEEEQIEEIKKEIKKINVVLTSFEIDPQELKSKNNLLI